MSASLQPLRSAGGNVFRSHETERVRQLDVAESIDDAGKLRTIAVVNRSATERVEVALEVQGRPTRGPWTVHELDAPSIDAANSLKDAG